MKAQATYKVVRVRPETHVKLKALTQQLREFWGEIGAFEKRSSDVETVDFLVTNGPAVIEALRRRSSGETKEA